MQVILQPIDSSRDDIELRIQKLDELLESPSFDHRNLQQMLQGMILARTLLS